MAQRSGGRIPPDGRPAQAPQPGANARRHDLEQPKTPGLHNSDLQQGDVQALEQGQRIVPVPTQQPAATADRPAPRQKPVVNQRGGAQPDVPDPIDFMGGRLRGTLDQPATSSVGPTVDVQTWMPLLRILATAPGASGVMAQAYVTQMRNAMSATFVHETPIIDMQEADIELAALLGV